MDKQKEFTISKVHVKFSWSTCHGRKKLNILEVTLHACLLEDMGVNMIGRKIAWIESI